MIVTGFALTVLLKHSFLYLAGLYGFLWPSRRTSLQMRASLALELPAVPQSGTIPTTAPAAVNSRESSEHSQRLANPTARWRHRTRASTKTGPRSRAE